MPPSQLKSLKSSLRAEGVLGPQKSKKQKKRQHANGSNPDEKAQRAAALQRIREAFNPFEVKVPARGRDKFDVTSSKRVNGGLERGTKGRPGVTKGLGEETRRRTLLKEMHQRNRVGGITDRRFGEDDPTMTLDEKVIHRFTKEKQRGFRNNSIFNLEDDTEEGQLTHFGRSLSLLEDGLIEDFSEDGLGSEDQSSSSETKANKRKRKRLPGADDEEDTGAERSHSPERKKSKAEVMKEVIAKSKYHKYERQQAKEDDEEVREELDKGLPDLLALMGSLGSNTTSIPSSGNIAMEHLKEDLLGTVEDGAVEDKIYDRRVREMILDRRSKPAEPTKTAEEKAEEEASRLHELEEQRLRRMKGEESDVEEVNEAEESRTNGASAEIDDPNDADTFGLGAGMATAPARRELGVEDEDEFSLDENLIASGSEIDDLESYATSRSHSPASQASDNANDEDDREFVAGLVTERDFSFGDSNKSRAPPLDLSDGLAYTYSCPQNLKEFVDITKDVPLEKISTIVQRIRALYHPQLHQDNKAKLGVFVTVLIEYVVTTANQAPHMSLRVLETLIRHIHSLAKAYPLETARAFRSKLKTVHNMRPTALEPGDLITFTAIGVIFPTSDHFHPVVTPSILSMGRYLGQKQPTSLSDLATGAYVGSLCLDYQRLSKRYIPELVNYTVNAISNLAPVKLDLVSSTVAITEFTVPFHVTGSYSGSVFLLGFRDVVPRELSVEEEEQLKCSLLNTYIALVQFMAELWSSHVAFCEVFALPQLQLQHLQRKPCRDKLPPDINDNISKTSSKLQILLNQAHLARRPLALHYHRPLAIKTSIPKFEEAFDPEKHYDPDRERNEFNKLKAEHKREKKGALRELRKDTNFIARESLKEKRERDQEYERKYKRLVADIQREEGHEAKVYEREKRFREAKKR